MSDTFEATCRRCGTYTHVTVPAKRTIKPFTCPGCAETIIVDAQIAGTPAPQHDTSQSPVSGSRITHMFSRFGGRGESCPVCGAPEMEPYDHSDCEAAQQVEPYSP